MRFLRLVFAALVAALVAGGAACGARETADEAGPARTMPAVAAAPHVSTGAPIVALGAHGDLAGWAVSGCRLAALIIPRDEVISITADVTDCTVAGWYKQVAIAGRDVVWSAFSESNHLYAGIHVHRVGAAEASARELYSGVDEDIGGLAADDNTIAFSTQGGGYYGGALATLRVWDGRRLSSVRQVTGWMDDVDVEGPLVAVGYRNGRTEVFDRTRRLVSTLAPGAATRGLELDAGRLVALTDASATTYALPAGTAAASRLLGAGGRNVRLLDARGGLVAYRSGAQLRLLRLADGRDVRIPATAPAPEAEGIIGARFASGGLVVVDADGLRLLPALEIRRVLGRGR